MPDPFDQLLQSQELGLLLRTDFSDEDAWQAFCSNLCASEEEFAEALQPEVKEGILPEQDVTGSDSDESTNGLPTTPLIKVINPATAEDRLVFHNMSNLSALRLFNDIDIRRSPNPPPGKARINPSSRLIDQAGWQEIYTGVTIWIYDSLSNIDQSVRLVSQQGGELYGTATYVYPVTHEIVCIPTPHVTSGDSWRVRGTHICELQFSISCLAMTIDFGDLDRWDYGERQRNLVEANQLIT